jgi:hypothetical protein
MCLFVCIILYCFVLRVCAVLHMGSSVQYMCLSVLLCVSLCYSDMLLFLFSVTLFSVQSVNVNILFRLCHDCSLGILVL